VTNAEFYKTVIEDTDSLRKTYDLRPFGDLQSEARDWFLNDMVETLKAGLFSNDGKAIFILYDRGIEIRESSMKAVSYLLDKGVPINIEAVPRKSVFRRPSARKAVKRKGTVKGVKRKGRKRSTKLRYK
jgi:hypothetical protein